MGLPTPVVTPASASRSGVQRSSDLGRSEIFQFSAYAGRATAVAAEYVNHVQVWIRPLLLLGPGLNLRQHLLRLPLLPVGIDRVLVSGGVGFIGSATDTRPRSLAKAWVSGHWVGREP